MPIVITWSASNTLLFRYIFVVSEILPANAKTSGFLASLSATLYEFRIWEPRIFSFSFSVGDLCRPVPIVIVVSALFIPNASNWDKIKGRIRLVGVGLVASSTTIATLWFG